MRFKILFFILLSCFMHNANAQYFDSLSAYPDTNICHLNKMTHFTGQVMGLSINTSYSIAVDYGDGTIQTVSKTSTGFTEDFTLSHNYTSAGNKNVRIVLLNGANNPLDTIDRVYDVGNCSVSSGIIFFDCINNCTKEPMEMGFRSRFFYFYRNGQIRSYWLDTNGAYNIPIFAGDTITRRTGALAVGLYFSSCVSDTIMPGVINQDIPVNLVQNVTIDSVVYGCENVCVGATQPWVSTVYNNGYNWSVKRDYGDGNSDCCFTSGALPVTLSSPAYTAPGDYIVTYYLYSGVNGVADYGPIMKAEKSIHVRTCTPINVSLYYDENKNCIKDLGEEIVDEPGYEFLGSVLTSVNYATNVSPAGIMSFSLFPGDTLFPSADIYRFPGPVNGWVYFPDVTSIDSSCNIMITGSQTVFDIPYKPKVVIDYISSNIYSGCLPDTFAFSIPSYNFGVKNTTTGHLYIDYSDGIIDTQAVAFTMDTMTLYAQHRYQTPGQKQVKFILTAGNYSDTAFQNITVLNCNYVNVRAYIDYNKNCFKDTNEQFLSSFNVNTGFGNSFAPDTVAVTAIDISSDSLLSVSHGTNNFYRTLNADTCGWPVFTPPYALYYDIPIIENVNVSGSIARFKNVCDSLVDFNISLNFNCACVIPKYLKIQFFSGDGSPSHDTIVRFDNSYQAFYWIMDDYMYAPGTYYAGMKAYDTATGVLVYSFQTPTPMSIIDTCSILKGVLFHDTNSNCLKDTSEIVISNTQLQVIKDGVPHIVFTDNLGNYQLPATNGEQIQILFPAILNNSYSLNCTSANTVFTFQDSAVIDAAYTCQPSMDVSVSGSYQYWTAGQVDTVALYVNGTSCLNQSGILDVQLDNNFNFVYSDFPGVQQNGQQLVWNVSSLDQLPSVIRVVINISPLAPQGQQLCLTANIQSSIVDTNLSNNNFSICDSVLTALPTIHKNIATGDSGNVMIAGIPVVYTVTFANTTPDTVIQVIVLDTLSSMLDINTLQIINSTYPVQVSIINNDVLKLTCSGISLLPGTSGSVSFSISPVAGFPATAVVTNSATVIYGYDVIGTSNKASSQTKNTNAVENFVYNNGSYKVYPNPAQQTLYIDLNKKATDKKVQIFDQLGRLRKRDILKHGLNNLTIEDLDPGIYYLRIKLDANFYHEKILVK